MQLTQCFQKDGFHCLYCSSAKQTLQRPVCWTNDHAGERPNAPGQLPPRSDAPIYWKQGQNSPGLNPPVKRPLRSNDPSVSDRESMYSVYYVIDRTWYWYKSDC